MTVYEERSWLYSISNSLTLHRVEKFKTSDQTVGVFKQILGRFHFLMAESNI